MKIKDPFKLYEKNKNAVTLQDLKKAENYIQNFLKTNKEISFEPTSILLEKLILESVDVLGYYLNPKSTLKYLQDLMCLCKPFINEMEISSSSLKEINAQLLLCITEKNIQFNKKIVEIEGNIYHVIVSFKNAPMELTELKTFINLIGKHCKDNTAKIIFYMADNFFKDVPKIDEKEIEEVENLMIILNNAKPLLNVIARNNLLFRNINKKYLSTYTLINNYMQKIISPNTVDILENTRDFVNPIQFNLFLKHYTKTMNIKYDIVDSSKKEKIMQVINQNSTNGTFFLNVKSFLQYYNKRESYLNFDVLEDYKMENHMDLVTDIFKNKQEVNDANFIQDLENNSLFEDLVKKKDNISTQKNDEEVQDNDFKT
jgi:hypothetical protein